MRHIINQIKVHFSTQRVSIANATRRVSHRHASCMPSPRVVFAMLLLMAFADTWAQPTSITSLRELESTGNYIITSEIDARGYDESLATFSGTLEAAIDPATKMPYHIKNLGVPLFATLTGTVKNLVLEDVSISGNTGNTGAIACTADEDARIYNVGILSGSVGGSGYTGGLVGLLDGSARVINCYSYANITAGSEKAGIVGHNNFASKYDNIKTMVMNCMFYGDIATGGTVSPIYGGLEISNDYSKTTTSNRLNNYNYFLYEAPFSKNNTTTHPIITFYNCALAAERRFLVRFEFYRHLLNSTRELAAWYATGLTVDAHTTMKKWVLDTEIAPYPILKEQGKYPSIVNYDPNVAPKTPEAVKTLTVNITGRDITIASLSIPITDKDPAHYNYNYHKVQLPYYNDVGTGNYTNNRVVTGWKITAIDAVAGDPYSSSNYTVANYDTPNYNFADRGSSQKDLYSVSGRVFSQGGYFNVPEGVSSITIEPYWGKAVYLSDACYDRYGYGYIKNDALPDNDDLIQVGGGQRYINGDTYSINGSDQVVYTTISNALNALKGVSNPTVYDYAVVLVGNYHHHAELGRNGPELSSGTKPFTIMSIDLNRDNEPDYCLIYRSGKNRQISPIRYDFITVPGMAMAHKMKSNGDLAIPGNCCPKGWFEITTTGLIKFGQFEHSYNDKALAPVIFMGGVIDQFVANNTQGHGSDAAFNDKTKYMLFGDNVWFKMLSNGTHMDNTAATPHRPISLIGGEYEKLYLSGYFSPSALACTAEDGDKNAECYINGGKFGEVAGAAQENIDGDVTWQIDHADISSFYGGGVKASDQKQITGNISTTIKNSNVTLFCGGPKFGDMETGKIVTTVADNCTFGTYFGAGYGGTSIYRECPNEYNQYTVKNYNFNGWVSGSYNNSRGKYISGKGVSCGHEYELFAGSAGNVGRLYLTYASFTLAQTNDVTSTLTGCTVMGNFYGGGSLGKVAGDATSTLKDCTVHGSAFGAGFSASIPTAEVMNTGGYTVNGESTNPYYNEVTGVYESVDEPAIVNYKWVYVNSLGADSNALEDDGDTHTIKTTGDLSALGTVSGKATLNITGNTIVEGKVFDDNGNVTEQTGGAFGGGDVSAALGDTEVNVDGGTSSVIYNLFGGGNKADVGGSVVVNMNSGAVSNDIYGGGALADTNTGDGTTTTVNLVGGTVKNVYGGGLGQKAGFFGATSDVEAFVRGNVKVFLNGSKANGATNDCKVTGNIFGCNNLNGTPTGSVLVQVSKTVGYDEDHTKSDDKDNTTYDVLAVYGGGNLSAYQPTDDDAFAEVVIEGCDDSSIEYVYGGGNAASVPATKVTIYSAYEIGNVFGGGNGKDVLPNGDPNPGAHVGYLIDGTTEYGTGKAEVNALGGRIHSVFGGSNTLGNVRTESVAYLDEASDCLLKIDEVYGGGNEASMAGIAQIRLGCITSLGEIYGGAKQADVGSDVVLNITSGHFDRVFGGNNMSGEIQGTITVNIEETGCHPITIGELYGCGNQAAYTVPWKDEDDHSQGRKDGPTLNIKSFTSIGRVFGGGLGADAVVEGDPVVNINEVVGDNALQTSTYAGHSITLRDNSQVTLPDHASGKMGSIGSVFGGGNEAEVRGNTLVKIGTLPMVDYVTKTTDEGKDIEVKGADIRGNVFGGGNKAEVTGDTKVVVGKSTSTE